MKKRVLDIGATTTDWMDIESIGADAVITNQPVRIGYDLWVVVRQGCIQVASDMVVADMEENTFSVFNRERIVEVLKVSDDFEADVFLLSEHFENDLAISEFLSLKMLFDTHPTLPLNAESMEALADYHRMALRTIRLEGNPYKWESLLNLTRAFYYGGGYYFFQGQAHSKDSVLTRFLTLVEKNAAKEHEIGFYADRLCLTPKYLSRLFKRKTGRTAKEIISDYILLQARTMLLNSDSSIQQISNTLWFPSQSVFGKFFKNAVGVSPKAYRENKE